MKTDKLIEEISRISDSIRYVAIYLNGKLDSWQRGALNGTSTSESDKYEELLVNPTILKIAKQRGDIDCGGLDFVIIKYGNFYQLIREINDGHISICIDKNADPVSLEGEIKKLIQHYSSSG